VQIYKFLNIAPYIQMNIVENLLYINYKLIIHLKILFFKFFSIVENLLYINYKLIIHLQIYKFSNIAPYI